MWNKPEMRPIPYSPPLPAMGKPVELAMCLGPAAFPHVGFTAREVVLYMSTMEMVYGTNLFPEGVSEKDAVRALHVIRKWDEWEEERTDEPV